MRERMFGLLVFVLVTIFTFLVNTEIGDEVTVKFHLPYHPFPDETWNGNQIGGDENAPVWNAGLTEKW